jgi:hypothetical protein
MSIESLAIPQPWYIRLFSVKGRYLFPVLCGLVILNLFLNQEYVFTRQLFYQTYGEQVAIERIQSFLDMRDRFAWISYSMVPITLLVKVSYVAICIDIGMLFTKHDAPISFKKLFRVAMVSELVFVAAGFIKSAWIHFVIQPDTLTQVQHFYPLSLGSLADDLPSWMAYPMLTANLFEIIYIGVIAWGVNMMLGKSYKKAFTLTLSCYGVGLLLWAVLIVFLSINLS